MAASSELLRKVIGISCSKWPLMITITAIDSRNVKAVLTHRLA